MDEQQQPKGPDSAYGPEAGRQNGNLRISGEVVSTIAAMTAKEVKGVAGLSVRPNISEDHFAGKLARSLMGKSVHIEMHEGEAVIDVSVNVFYGAKIPDVADEIQTRVRDAVQNMTGIVVSKVNVQIAGMVLGDQPGEPIN